jgi:hypothetical protein
MLITEGSSERKPRGIFHQFTRDMETLCPKSKGVNRAKPGVKPDHKCHHREAIGDHRVQMHHQLHRWPVVVILGNIHLFPYVSSANEDTPEIAGSRPGVASDVVIQTTEYGIVLWVRDKTSQPRQHGLSPKLLRYHDREVLRHEPANHKG